MSDNNYYSRALIHLNHLKQNLKCIKSLVKKGTKILIPVKCNAYGLGLLPVSQFLEKEKVDYLGVAFPFEGMYLRKNKIKVPILVFSELIYEKDYKNIIEYHLTPSVFTERTLDQLDRMAKHYHKIISIHIKVDTGMGRNGINKEQAISFIEKASHKKNLHVEGVYTHLSAAEELNKGFTQRQIHAFDALIQKLNIDIPLVHILNSAGIMNYPKYSYSMVRPGIMFYGYYPDNQIKKNIIIKQGMTLQTRVSFLKQTRKGTPISYGHTYYTTSDEILATASCGYGDGLNRLLSNQHQALYKNQLCPIRGRICMDQFMIDVSNIKNPQQGDWITLFGHEDKKEIRLEKIARQLKTIPYEILCTIGDRVERKYQV